jgi:hypothetical protein
VASFPVRLSRRTGSCGFPNVVSFPRDGAFVFVWEYLHPSPRGLARVPSRPARFHLALGGRCATPAMERATHSRSRTRMCLSGRGLPRPEGRRGASRASGGDAQRPACGARGLAAAGLISAAARPRTPRRQADRTTDSRRRRWSGPAPAAQSSQRPTSTATASRGPFARI